MCLGKCGAVFGWAWEGFKKKDGEVENHDFRKGMGVLFFSRGAQKYNVLPISGPTKIKNHIFSDLARVKNRLP